MDFKPIDYFTISLSFLALLVSVITSFFQKRKETFRSVRKDLTNTLDGLAKINFEFNKLKQLNDYSSEPVMGLRRALNSQRKVLVVHAVYLAEKYDLDLPITDADCSMIANALDSIDDYTQAEIYYQKAINKSHSNKQMLHYNLRSLAVFKFYMGDKIKGRDLYREALLLDLGSSDAAKRIRIDTYLIWSRVEFDYENPQEALRQLDEAKSIFGQIGQKGTKDEIAGKIAELELHFGIRKKFVY